MRARRRTSTGPRVTFLTGRVARADFPPGSSPSAFRKAPVRGTCTSPGATAAIRTPAPSDWPEAGTQKASTISAASARPVAMPAVRIGAIAELMSAREELCAPRVYWFCASQRSVCVPVLRPSASGSLSIETVTRYTSFSFWSQSPSTPGVAA